jgi:hypothetical protein
MQTFENMKIIKNSDFALFKNKLLALYVAKYRTINQKNNGN